MSLSDYKCHILTLGKKFRKYIWVGRTEREKIKLKKEIELSKRKQSINVMNNMRENYYY